MRRFSIVVLAALVLATPARAGVDLRDTGKAGTATSDTAPLASVGDVNGDGAEDVAVGLQFDTEVPDGAHNGGVGVIGFGASLDRAAPGFAGLVVKNLNDPPLSDDRGSVSFGMIFDGGVTGVGDWDGDGLADVALAGSGAGPRGRPDAGSVYVVLGRREPGTIDAQSDPRVVRIDGAVRGGELGRRMGAAGDFDGDGRPDLALALPGERAVVVRGGAPAGTAIDLAAPPPGSVIELNGLDGGKPPAEPDDLPQREPQPETAGFAPVGDVDGDGRGELLVGVPSAIAIRGRGRAFVVRGAAGGSTVDVRTQSLARLVGPRSRPGFGGAVATLPDSDGDGRPEWIVSAAAGDGVFGFPGELPNGGYVVFSRARGEVRAGRAGQPVVTVDARGRGPTAGRSLAGIPDATGDGVPDLLVGLPDANPSCRARAGAIALVPGRRTPGRVRIDARAPRVDGPYPGAEVGDALAVGAGRLFLGTRPFQNAASLDLWRPPIPSGASPATPADDDCLSVKITKPTRAQLRHTLALRVTVHSNAGDNRAHRIRLRTAIVENRDFSEGPYRVIALPHTGTRTLTLPLPRGAAAQLASGTRLDISVEADQRLGPAPRTTSGANNGAGFILKGDSPL